MGSPAFDEFFSQVLADFATLSPATALVTFASAPPGETHAEAQAR
jgi:hypothetical protein